MKKEFEGLIKEYQNVPIPNNLNNVINKSINNYRKEKIKMRNRRQFKSIIAASLIIISTFTIGVNTSESFAINAKRVPVISALVKLVSFEHFEINSEFVKANVNIPAVEGFKSEALAMQINEEIKEKMNNRLKEGKSRAKEYRKAFIETGGREKDFRPLKIEIDYNIKSFSENTLSFSVHYFESLASSYAKTYYYTVDLTKDKLLSLEDLLGSNYENTINKQVSKKIEKDLEEYPSKYFQGEMGFKGISKDQAFYIDKANNIVIVFDKYEIAPGSSGEPEFIIEE